ncbi:hypothetical protein MM221_11875 [Salipaludibacillus sp. LMS25]|jgi:hypothetical protein|uniref:hypothetical protein n=1 Tax=Salipaludibacillus sp. LMS25 TaxID=2924031 RepID=UPI0020D086B6|nr:hypothetical protein [Salipaludibacillus sp. LMS25]UTR13342.1 hypothetical protein MM221_11875 [Salipaludibacillus sp. LMS25]
MKKFFLSLIALFSVGLSACNNNELIDEFTVYQESKGLNVLQQTIPQPNEGMILAFYETADRKFGIIEFDNSNNLTSEKQIDDVSINTLKGKEGNYIGIKHSLEKISNVKKVDLYTGENDLISSFDLEGNESLSFFWLEEIFNNEYTVAFLDNEDKIIYTEKFNF